MDLNDLLLLTAALSSILTLARVMRIPAARFWVPNLVVILIATAAAWLYRRDIAGYVAFAAWVVLLLIPGLMQRRMARRLVRHDFRDAARLAGVVRWLAPSPYTWRLPALLNAIDLGEQGRNAEAADRLAALRHSPGMIADMAAAHAYRLRLDWDGLVQWVQQDLNPATLRSQPGVLALYLRALGETGRVNDLIETLASLWPSLQSPLYVHARRPCLLAAFAFGGRPDATAAMLPASPNGPTDADRLWLATAASAAGDADAGQAILSTVSTNAPATIRTAADDRLRRPIRPAASVLSDGARLTLDALERDVRHERQFAAMPHRSYRSYATNTLILLNVAAFLLEAAAGGTTNDEALFRLGAANLAAVTVLGQWWRILAANFLHYGIGHLAANMVGLYVLGRWLEHHVGRTRYLVVYLASGLGAMSVALAVARWRGNQFETLVGASGCVMGLVGATAAVLLTGWLRHRAGVALRRLRAVVLIVALQTVFDILIPQISFTAHAAGTAIGFLLTLLLTLRRPKSATAPARPSSVNAVHV